MCLLLRKCKKFQRNGKVSETFREENPLQLYWIWCGKSFRKVSTGLIWHNRNGRSGLVYEEWRLYANGSGTSDVQRKFPKLNWENSSNRKKFFRFNESRNFDIPFRLNRENFFSSPSRRKLVHILQAENDSVPRREGNWRGEKKKKMKLNCSTVCLPGKTRSAWSQLAIIIFFVANLWSSYGIHLQAKKLIIDFMSCRDSHLSFFFVSFSSPLLYDGKMPNCCRQNLAAVDLASFLLFAGVGQV